MSWSPIIHILEQPPIGYKVRHQYMCSWVEHDVIEDVYGIDGHYMGQHFDINNPVEKTEMVHVYERRIDHVSQLREMVELKYPDVVITRSSFTATYWSEVNESSRRSPRFNNNARIRTLTARPPRMR